MTTVARGSCVGRSLQAAELLSAESIDIRMIAMHTIKPLDAEAVVRAAEDTGVLLTVEEHSIVGGLGSAVA